jgi:hypothetical protein
MMLRWISSVPPAIEVARTDTRISAQHAAEREGATGHALAVGAVAGVDHDRRLGDLVAHRTALATTGLREFHRVVLQLGLPRRRAAAIEWSIVVSFAPPSQNP